MEKPWMPALVDMLQAPPAKERPKPEQPAVTSASPDHLAHEPDSQSAAPAKGREPEHPDAPQSLPAGFADELSRQWAPATRTPLEFGADTYWSQSWSDRVMEHVPRIAVALLFLAVLAALSFFFRVQVGHSLVFLGEKISGQPAQQSAVSLPSANAMTQPALPPTQSASSSAQPGSVQPGPVEQPVSSPNPSPAAATPPSAASTAAPALGVAKNSPPSSNATSNVSSSSTARPDSAQSSALQSTSQASSAHGNGQSEFLLAQSALHQARTPEAKARAAQLLWDAVTAGSSDAEIALADIYGRGDGGQKNCLQARILLAAATDKQNPLAARESAELSVYGCR